MADDTDDALPYSIGCLTPGALDPAGPLLLPAWSRDMAAARRMLDQCLEHHGVTDFKQLLGDEPRQCTGVDLAAPGSRDFSVTQLVVVSASPGELDELAQFAPRMWSLGWDPADPAGFCRVCDEPVYRERPRPDGAYVCRFREAKARGDADPAHCQREAGRTRG